MNFLISALCFLRSNSSTCSTGKILSLRGSVRTLVKPANIFYAHLRALILRQLFSHLQTFAEFRVLSYLLFNRLFQILDSAATKFQVKLKESMYIKWKMPDLNQKVKYINLTLSLLPPSPTVIFVRCTCILGPL